MGSVTDRLITAEREGLRLALFSRTLVVGLGFAWYLMWSFPNVFSPLIVGVFALLVASGAIHLYLIKRQLDQPWMKYASYALDISAICAAFALMPVTSNEPTPQILVYRAYGIYYLFPLIAMAALSLSPRLVVWTGCCVVIGWWAAYLSITLGDPDLVEWSDFGRLGYQEIVLHPKFSGRGNRIEETAMTLAAALILALAVQRAKRVFFAQVEAETARRRATELLGQFAPEDVAQEMLENDAALRPQVTDGAALVLDIADFTAFAAGREPEAVIAALNDFLGAAADRVHAAGGVVAGFTGDGLLAAFNAGRALDRPIDAAVEVARALQTEAAKAGFSTRLGVAAGPLAAGAVGSSARRAFTVYGDTVNRAARLEAFGKECGEAILLDAESAAAAPAARSLGRHSLRGLAGQVEIYALSANISAISTAK